jgi:hypothetical protein
MPLERARTLLVKGMLERRARRRGDAKASFEEALEVFERAGARLWADRARARSSIASGCAARRATN